MFRRVLLLSLILWDIVQSFVNLAPQGPSSQTKSLVQQSATISTTAKDELATQKKKLFELFGKSVSTDPVLADPITKDPVQISVPGVLLGGETSAKRVQYKIRSPTNSYAGSSDSYIDLLEPISDGGSSSVSLDDGQLLSQALKWALPLVPAPLRASLGNLGLNDEKIIPMRDLFTSPAVSFYYERGWRQSFARAGFPGADTEAKMAIDYFAPVVARNTPNSIVVDMSCATGLFTRRLARTNKYGRVLGCDYSGAMLMEARRRIRSDPKLSPTALKTRLDLVRLDVGQIPMQTESVDCLHAGAAMHCWPDLDAAASEIYRVLKPGGRYFATTFLSSAFQELHSINRGASGPSALTFQYFESVDTIRSVMERAGFEPENIFVEVLQPQCVVIRCEK